MDKVLDQEKMIAAMDNDDVCSGSFRLTFGIPCKHEIKRIISEGSRLNIEDFHAQWHLDILTDETQPIQNLQDVSPRSAILNQVRSRIYSIDNDLVPSFISRLDSLCENSERLQNNILSNPIRRTRTRGRPEGSQNRSNQRDRSHFEYTTGIRCRNCRQPGHNRRSCRN